ncbi:MAG: hypothetical protein QXQ65_06395 [Conexivisphaerales archaeon]
MFSSYIYQGLTFGTFALIFYTVSDLLVKYPAAKMGNRAASIITIGVSNIPIVIALALTANSVHFTYMVVPLSAISGICLGGGTLMVLKSLESQQVTNTMALIELGLVLTVIYGILVLHEPERILGYAGVASIFAGSLLVSTKGLSINTKLIPAMVGNIIWGGQFLAIYYAISYTDNILLPALISSLTAVVTIELYALLFGGHHFHYKPGMRKSLYVGIISGAFLGLGLIAVMFIMKFHVLPTGMSLIAIEPVFITLLGVVFYKDSISRVQALGVVLATLGAILLVE